MARPIQPRFKPAKPDRPQRPILPPERYSAVIRALAQYLLEQESAAADLESLRRLG